MTIIKPNKSRAYLGFIASMFLVILLGGMVYIHEYNALADSRYELSQLKERVVQAEVKNAELKNSFYELVDPAKLGPIAGEEGLILDKTPDYLNINQWVSDSSF